MKTELQMCPRLRRYYAPIFVPRYPKMNSLANNSGHLALMLQAAGSLRTLAMFTLLIRIINRTEVGSSVFHAGVHARMCIRYET